MSANENEANANAISNEQIGFTKLAVEKIAKELSEFKGGPKETAVSKFVASTLTHFCEESKRFAEILYKTPRTLSECCAEVMSGTGNAVSDIDVYRGAVQSYFPNADIEFKMNITITGDAPSEEEINRPSKQKVTAPKHKKKETADTPGSETEQKPASVNRPPQKKTQTNAEKPKTETLQLSLF